MNIKYITNATIYCIQKYIISIVKLVNFEIKHSQNTCKGLRCYTAKIYLKHINLHTYSGGFSVRQR